VAPKRIGRLELALWIVAIGAVVVAPYGLSRFEVVQMSVFLIYAMLAVSLDLVWGIAGILSFGQAALFGVGGYLYGIVGINTDSTVLALLAGMAAPMLLAAIIGYVTFYGRVGPMYFAVITLTVTLILFQLMGNTADPRYAVGAARLGGYNGMTNIPTFTLELPGVLRIGPKPVPQFYAVATLLLVALLFCVVLSRTTFGRILRGIRENETRTELLGYDPRWRKLVVFVLSGAIAGLAGGLFASWGNFINPEVFSLPQSALVVIWVLVGGRGTLYGAALGAIVVQYIASTFGAAGSTYTTVMLGSVLVLIVLLFRDGLGPALWRLPATLLRRGTAENG
jgi:ABC-type branched-subunit amino acid transport system permease subunit